ncbi:MAG: thiamine diphosphokinase [Clostridia bacterium]|nr:thiamine diphosphokinase [Clostridia bacterium]
MRPVCHIVCAGDFDEDCFSPRDGDFVIACDAGLFHLEKCGTVPDLTVGDFDSYDQTPAVENVVFLPRRKDDTDSAYALKLGLEKGYTRFILHGALGGARISHSLANISLLMFLRDHGAEGILCGKKTCAALLESGSAVFAAEERGFISVFAVSPECEVTLKDLKFPFSGTIKLSFPLGVSNEFTGDRARIEVKSGTLLWVYEGETGDPARFFGV